jgi:poly(A) polymerase
MSNPPQTLGVTPPLSLALPTQKENEASNALIEELRRQNNFETVADSKKRSVQPAAIFRRFALNALS